MRITGFMVLESEVPAYRLVTVRPILSTSHIGVSVRIGYASFACPALSLVFHNHYAHTAYLGVPSYAPGSRRRPEWVYLTASIRVPPPLLRGTRGAGADWGCIGGFGYGTSAGGSCGSGASSSTSSGDFFCYGPTSSRSGGKRGKSISSFSSASGSAHAGSGGVGAGEEDGPASSTPSSRRGARSHNSECTIFQAGTMTWLQKSHGCVFQMPTRLPLPSPALHHRFISHTAFFWLP